MIDFNNLKSVVDMYEGIIPGTCYEKAVRDVNEIQSIIESLPVFEDTGEHFNHEFTEAWGILDGWTIDGKPARGVSSCHITFKEEKWQMYSMISDTYTDMFYSTRQAAEAAMKGDSDA